MTTQDQATDSRARLLADLPVTERRHSLAGVSTASLEGGEGPPLVLLHGPASPRSGGCGSSPSWWRPIA